MITLSKQVHPWKIVLLFLGTILIGALTVLIGCLLPSFANIKDADAGLLLMVQFAFGATGALLVRRNFLRTERLGFCLVVLGVLLFVVLPRAIVCLPIAVYGLGLGLAMTSISMIVGRLFSHRRGAALILLNFCWSLGSTLTPLLIAGAADRFSLQLLPVLIVVVTTPFIFTSGGDSAALVPVGDEAERSIKVRVPAAIAYFAFLGFLYVGIESSVGGWMTTYASRLVPWGHTKSNLVTACFWGALLIGRGVTPAALFMVTELRLYFISVAGATAGLVLLVNAHSAPLLIVGASLIGFSLAPIFPLIISFFMAVAGDTPNSGWVFAMPGFGAACLPWLTGVASTYGHSLRIGLAVPIAAAVLMIALSFRMRRWTHQPRLRVHG